MVQSADCKHHMSANQTVMELRKGGSHSRCWADWHLSLLINECTGELDVAGVAATVINTD